MNDTLALLAFAAVMLLHLGLALYVILRMGRKQ